jgi:hypothetical protein
VGEGESLAECAVVVVVVVWDASFPSHSVHAVHRGGSPTRAAE